MNEQANNQAAPAVIQDFLAGLNTTEEVASEAAKPKRSAKIDLETQNGLAAAFKSGKLNEDMLDPYNESHHEWINKCREAEAAKPVWLRLAPNDAEFYGEFLFVGVNGKDYPLPVNRWAKVPMFVHMHLSNCQNTKLIHDKDDNQRLGEIVGEVRSDRFVYRISDTQPKLGKNDPAILEYC